MFGQVAPAEQDCQQVETPQTRNFLFLFLGKTSSVSGKSSVIWLCTIMQRVHVIVIAIFMR